MMISWTAVYVLWLREMKRYVRAKSRIIGSLIRRLRHEEHRENCNARWPATALCAIITRYSTPNASSTLPAAPKPR